MTVPRRGRRRLFPVHDVFDDELRQLDDQFAKLLVFFPERIRIQVVGSNVPRGPQDFAVVAVGAF